MLTRAAESFLPFHLEYAFSSALLLSIMQTVAPRYVGEVPWLATANNLLDNMIKRGNMVAQLRKSELGHLEQYLVIVRHADDGTFHFSPADTHLNANNQQQPYYNNHNFILQGSLSTPTQVEPSYWDGLFGPGPMTANHEQILDLAAQFDGEDFDSSFLFDV